MQEPVTAATLARILRAALVHGVIRFSRHALDEMEKDDLAELDCTNVLRGGTWDGCDFEKGTWRYRVRTPKIVVVVTLLEDGAVRLVTAWRVR